MTKIFQRRAWYCGYASSSSAVVFYGPADVCGRAPAGRGGSQRQRGTAISRARGSRQPHGTGTYGSQGNVTDRGAPRARDTSAGASHSRTNNQRFARGIRPPDRRRGAAAACTRSRRGGRRRSTAACGRAPDGEAMLLVKSSRAPATSYERTRARRVREMTACGGGGAQAGSRARGRS